ncbi:Fic family protein [Hyphomicrobium sp. xq]|uniref:Fic family protein n=2 Tax=Hyphomicrobium album TaxID=2665159 RepID=A0A6I3KMD8_9HYPH|nr:Fic family protein [Hyphomicrobium album]
MVKNSKNLNTSGFAPTAPYNALPALPGRQALETVPVLRKCVTASRALAGLKEAAHLIPNQDVLINSIPLREARDSSAIENIVTTNDTLFKYANIDPEKADDATKEALRYRTALMQGFKDVQQRPLSTSTAVLVCRAIKNVELDVRQVPGTALAHQPSGKVIYTPPEGQALLREKLTDWERFLHTEDDLDPIIRMAAAHYQFEAIHPFTDGNGRTGRVLNTLYLIDKKLLDLPILYLSRYINEHRSEYYDRLLAVTTSGAWESWLLYMLTAVEETSLWTTAKIRAVRDLMDGTVAYVSAASPKVYSRELVEVIFTQPYSRIADVVDAGIANRATASKYLKELAAKGLLEERKEGRENIYVNVRFLDLLTSDRNSFKKFS